MDTCAKIKHPELGHNLEKSVNVVINPHVFKYAYLSPM